MYLRILIMINILLFSQPSLAWFNNWPDIYYPDETKVSWVAKNIKSNGRHMQILQLENQLSPEETLHFFEDEWENNYKGSRLVQIENKMVLSTIVKQFSGDFFICLELEAAQHTKGVISIIKAGSSKHPAEVIHHHLPENAEIYTDIFALDGDVLSRTLVANVPSMSPKQLKYSLKSRLEHDHWSGSSNDDVLLEAQLMRFNKDASDVTITFSDNGTSLVTLIYTQPK